MQKKPKHFIPVPSKPSTKDTRASSKQKPIPMVKQTRSKHGYSGKFLLKDASKKQSSQQIVSQVASIPPTIKHLAYEKIKKIKQLLQYQKQQSYDQICYKFRQQIKDDLQYYGFTVDNAKSQIGRIILNDGQFYVLFSKINFKSEFVIKDIYLKNLKIKYLPKVRENKNILLQFIKQQEFKLQQEKKKRQSQLRKKLKISQQVDIFGYSQSNPQQLKKSAIITKQQKIQNIKKNQSYLIDFFQINDVYDDNMVDVIGIIDQIDDQYAIMLVKQIKQDENQQNQLKDNGKNKKQTKQVLAIALMKNIQNHQHKKEKLKQIQKKHPNIFAYVHVDDPQTVFFNALPDDSVKSNSIKKENLKISQSFTLNFNKNKW